MKNNRYLLLFVVALLGLTSCINDLDVKPLDPTVDTADKIYSNPENYEKALIKIYSAWALHGQDEWGDIAGLDPGSSVLLRGYFTLQGQSADEMKASWNDTWSKDVNSLTWGTTKNDQIEGVYQRAMFLVALVNEYMKNIPNAPESVDKVRFAAEARFCRALSYFVLMDMYGRPPFITEKNYSLNPSQLERKDLFKWIESELIEIRDDLPTPAEVVYGRASQGAVDALLSRMYLNAQVYTGETRYDDCIEASKRVIAAGYELAPVYRELFMADNGENPDTRKEFIFPIIFDGQSTMSYAISALIQGCRGVDDFNDVPAGIDGGWSGMRASQNLTRAFEYADNDNPKASEILDKRGIFYDKGRTIDITTTPILTFETEGWSVHKFTNIKSNGEPGSSLTFPDTDFPLFRLGEVYLNYAEAVARGGQGGSEAKAVEYVNALRKRGFGDESHNIDAAWLKDTGFRNILMERMRELYWEGVRRTDLVRYDLLTSGSYLWPSKGGIITGIGVDKRYNVFPIPSSDMGVNNSLVQNEGYK